MAATIKFPSSSSTESSRSKSPLRQNGFAIATSNGNADDGNTANGTSSSPQHYEGFNPRSRTTTSSTITLKEHARGTSATHRSDDRPDSDVEMDEADNKVSGRASCRAYPPIPSLISPHLTCDSWLQPSASSSFIPIPKMQDARGSETQAATTASQTPSDLNTPPDRGVSRSQNGPANGGGVGFKTPSSHNARLSSVKSMTPGFPSSQSFTSAQWSPGRSSEPHTYGISGSSSRGSYPYSSVKPYLSTSFRTSAERSGSSQVDDAAEEDEDHDEDVFGHTASRLGIHGSRPSVSGPRAASHAMVGEMDGDGDSAGVFSFSSPYLRPQSVDDHVPAFPPSPPDAAHAGPSQQRGRPGLPDRILSPSWTARSLQKLTIGGGGVEMAPSTSNTSSNSGLRRPELQQTSSQRASRPSHMHHPHSYAHSAFSRSLPSGSAASHQARRLSSGRMARPAMPPSSVSAYSISPNAAALGGPATFGSATLYSRSPSNNSPYARSPGTNVGYGAGMRPSPYHTHGAPPGRISGNYTPDPASSRRDRSSSRQRWAIPHNSNGLTATQASQGLQDDEDEEETEDEDEDDEDDETDDEMMMLPGDATGGRMDEDDNWRGSSRARGPSSAFAPSSMPSAASASSRQRSSSRSTGAAMTSSSGTRTQSSSVLDANGEVDDDGTGPPPDEMLEVSTIRDRLGGAANCAAFIAKLWFLVTRPNRYGKYLHWNSTGSTVILSTDPDISNEFASEVLPRLWNHANYSSFIRQMNLYGFQRLPSSRILEKDEIRAAHTRGMKGPDGQSPTELSTAQQLYGSHSSFLHPQFVRGREDLLTSLKPRNAKKPKAGGGAGGSGGGAAMEDE